MASSESSTDRPGEKGLLRATESSGDVPVLGRACPGTTVAPIGHVLVPLDGSALAESILPVAVALSRAFEARVTLLHVHELPHGGTVAPRPVDPLEWEMTQTEIARYLELRRQELGEEGLVPAVEIVQGRPAEQILQTARERGADLIALASHGASGTNAWTRSATADRVIALADTSILVLPTHHEYEPTRAWRLERLLLPLDCSPRAEVVIPIAVALALRGDAEIIVAHVVPALELPRRIVASGRDRAMAVELAARNREEAGDYLAGVVERLVAQGVRARMRLLDSVRLVPSLLRLADDESADLTILAAHGCSADPEERHGTVACRFLRESRRAVLVCQDMTVALRESARAHAMRENLAHH
ncbi:MAG TPA: universal stress protein [Candidatus Binatia bacterium]|nr:universal stress protein [Candidatus Binatia bacterium]